MCKGVKGGSRDPRYSVMCAFRPSLRVGGCREGANNYTDMMREKNLYLREYFHELFCCDHGLN